MIPSTVRQPYLLRKVIFFIVCANYDKFRLVMMKNGRNLPKTGRFRPRGFTSRNAGSPSHCASCRPSESRTR